MEETHNIAILRMRLRADDTHYASGVIPAATYLALMSDAGAMLGLQRGETAGYLARWEGVDFTSVCRVGDFIEVRAETVKVGNRSRRVRAQVLKLIATSSGEPGQTTSGQVLDPPEVVASGEYVGVKPRADVAHD
ncbi:hypothetical protein GCM10009633_12750 [Janibacter melonis]|uniref:hotdog fold domain-containing protein n=1 Tax=Janibacter melonis TaxID=262209 RepID=UPI001E612E83|nr:hotdog fold domain-containing protein [Janibacter melonis]MCB5991350.1 hypothetical protein [Janibacter melonis]